jgi:two-component system chemotaxis sensor kinase CheA
VSCGKEVQLVIDGADTELDRSLIESIRDPLTHLIRNSVDHGIEPPDARAAAGKPRAGRLSLRAFNESGRVTIEVSDDGAGIAFEKVREKAVARGLVSAAEAAAMSPERVLQFIFEPGFSTAAQVTSVSGRGVGMDVVRTNIEAIGGTVDIHSTPGTGTTVRVHVPLTLAIMPALVVRCGSERFAIPQSAVGELVPVTRDRHGPGSRGWPTPP